VILLATLVPAQPGIAFEPSDCVKQIPAGTRNGPMVIGGKKGLFLVSPAGKALRRLTSGDDGEASFSPDGRRVAFQRNSRWGPTIGVVDVASGRTRVVYAPKPGAGGGIAPVWSADGKWVVFIRRAPADKNEMDQIVLVHPDGMGRHAVYAVSVRSSIPTLAVSDNGRCVVYQWGEFGAGALAIRPFDFSDGFNLIPFGATMPDGAEVFVPETAVFSPSGSLLYVAFPVTAGGDERQYIYSLAMGKFEGSPIKLVVTDGGYPVPSPDGRLLAYTSPTRRGRIRSTSGPPRDRRFSSGIVWDWTAAR